MSVKNARNSLSELTHAEVIRRLQIEIERAGSQAAAARVLGVNESLLGKTMKGSRNVAGQLLRALKLRRVTLVVHRYEPAVRGTRTRTVRKMSRGTDRIAPE